jgi:hypothetical protein
MPDFLDYDPLSGLRYDYSFNEDTGEASIHTSQNVQGLLDWTRGQANNGGTDSGIKKGWWLYAKIPPIVELQLRAKGINIHDPGATDRMIAEINANYPYLKCTEKTERGEKLVQVYDLKQP